MAAATGTENRALTLLGNKPMLAYVTDALKAAPTVGRILVVGDVPDSTDYTVVPGRETLMDNLLAGLEARGSAEGRVLIATSDIPFLTPEAAEDFLERASALNADFCYPIVPLARCAAQFPAMKRTGLKLREGAFTGGNLILLRPEVILAHRETVMKAYAARKKVTQIGAMLGWGLLARIVVAQTFAPGVLTLAQLERGVAGLLGPGATARAVITDYAEIGTDVDKPDDVVLARQWVAEQGRSTPTPGPSPTA